MDKKNFHRDENLDRRDLNQIVNYLAELDKSLSFSGMGMDFNIHEHLENDYKKKI